VYNTYTEDNLRYSQNAALDMYKEVNTGTNLPAQIDLYSVDGDEYKFLCMAKGGGSANKTYLYQETKALITPAKLKNYLVEKMRTLGTAACPPYHIAFVIGGTSAEATLKTVKLASTATTTACRPKVTNTARRSAIFSWSRNCCWKRRTRPRRAVRRQILRPRYPRDPPAAPRRLLPGRHGRLLLR
jgi:tartrate dehydratase alpha subunit/fumarate hydratase class I-like protein